MNTFDTKIHLAEFGSIDICYWYYFNKRSSPLIGSTVKEYQNTPYIIICYSNITVVTRIFNSPHSWPTQMSDIYCRYFQKKLTMWRHTWTYRALSYYSDLTLSQSFQPMAAQLSKKAALPLAKILATVSSHSNKTGPSESCLMLKLHSSSPPSAAYMHQWIESQLVQIMACRLFSSKPLSKPKLGYCQLDP